MRQVMAKRAGGPEVLERSRPPSRSRRGRGRRRGEAIGVSFADVWVRLGADGEPPYAPGIEVAGTVVAVGEGVETPGVGDRVAATPYETRGAYAELVRAPRRARLPRPGPARERRGSALPLNYLTAYAAVEQAARPRAGERVLVRRPAASGSRPSSFPPPRRRALRNRVRIEHAALAEEGVAHAIDYRSETGSRPSAA